MSATAIYDDSGGLLGRRNPNADRDADDYGPGAGGKKRKVPQFPMLDRIEPSAASEIDESETADPTPPTTFPTNYRRPRSDAAKACSFRKARFLRRKAAVITLYLDVQSAIIAGNGKLLQTTPTFPDVPAFEKLLPSLEDFGVDDWPMDKPGWRNNTGEIVNAKIPVAELWRTKFDERRRMTKARKPIVRGGWFPEGSFEFEMESRSSINSRARAKEQAALLRLINELRAIILTTAKTAALISANAALDDKLSHKTKKKSDRVIETDKLAPAKTLPAVSSTPSDSKDSVSMSQSNSTDSKETPGSGGKKKPKKKKRSVLANQSNPHHVDNYRPSRTVSPYGDPYLPYSSHADLLFPPPMRLLSTRPPRKGNPSVAVRASEDDYMCTFCEIQLFFSTEVVRKRAIRRMRAEIRRKENIKLKAKNVAEGKGKLQDDEDSCDDEDGDEEGEGHCGGYGRCSCGRAIKGPHKDHEPEPPDRPETETVFASKPISEAAILDDDLD